MKETDNNALYMLESSENDFMRVDSNAGTGFALPNTGGGPSSGAWASIAAKKAKPPF